MNKYKNTFLTPIQFTTIIISALLGYGLVYLPSAIARSAKQDSWISCLIGALYPLYMVIMANYMCKRFPRVNILKLSKKYFGKFLGSILNFLFISFFLFILTSELSGFGQVYIAYLTPFLKDYQVFLIALVPIAFVSYKGIKTFEGGVKALSKKLGFRSHNMLTRWLKSYNEFGIAGLEDKRGKTPAVMQILQQ